MLRLIVDSSASIKIHEMQQYKVDNIISLQILFNGKEYKDADMDLNAFYKEFMASKEFPKTSLPNLVEVEDMVNEYVDNGDDVLIMTISEHLSGENNALHMLFDGNEHIKIYDTKGAVGLNRILIKCVVNEYRDKVSLDELTKKMDELLPRIMLAAIPESLEYLHRGGRMAKSEFVVGSLLKIKPVLTLVNGKVKVLAKKIGLKLAKKYLAELINEDADEAYPIVPTYVYDESNINEVLEKVRPELQKNMTEKDNVNPSLACHWGPNCFGFMYVSKKHLTIKNEE